VGIATVTSTASLANHSARHASASGYWKDAVATKADDDVQDDHRGERGLAGFSWAPMRLSFADIETNC
jgi:hypothetical protein